MMENRAVPCAVGHMIGITCTFGDLGRGDYALDERRFLACLSFLAAPFMPGYVEGE